MTSIKNQSFKNNSFKNDTIGLSTSISSKVEFSYISEFKETKLVRQSDNHILNHNKTSSKPFEYQTSLIKVETDNIYTDVDQINDRDPVYQIHNENFQTFKNIHTLPTLNSNSPHIHSDPVRTDLKLDQKNLAYSFKQEKESSIHKLYNDFNNNQ